MSEESQFEFQLYTESSQKFDYYITGVSATLTAFFIHNLKVVEIGLNNETLQFVGVLFTACSLLAGLLQVERKATVTRLNHERNNRIRSLSTAENMVESQQMKHLTEDRTMTVEEFSDYKSKLEKYINRVNDAIKRHSAISSFATM